MNMKCIIAIIYMALAGTSGFILAAPANEVTTTYFSDSAKTKFVGIRILPCRGRLQTLGKQTRYYTKTSTKCSGGGASKPPAVPCEFRNNTNCLNLPSKRGFNIKIFR